MVFACSQVRWKLYAKEKYRRCDQFERKVTPDKFNESARLSTLSARVYFGVLMRREFKTTIQQITHSLSKQTEKSTYAEAKLPAI